MRHPLIIVHLLAPLAVAQSGLETNAPAPIVLPPVLVTGNHLDPGVPVVPLEAIGSQDILGPTQVRESGASEINDLAQNITAISTRPYTGGEAPAPNFSMRGLPDDGLTEHINVPIDGVPASPMPYDWELITSGYSGRIVLLSRPPGFGRRAAVIQPAAGRQTTTDSFDAAPAGSPADGWISGITGEGIAEWRVVKDAAAPSPPQVLMQSGLVPKPSFPLCLKSRTSLQDGFVEVAFKTVSGEIDQAAGLVWRAQDTNNYYVCRANALENNVVLYKVQNGRRTALDILGRAGGYGVETQVLPAQWQTLRIEFTGPQFRVFLDQRELFVVEDRTFTDAGQVGLWTKADSVTLFDDFRYGCRE